VSSKGVGGCVWYLDQAAGQKSTKSGVRAKIGVESAVLVIAGSKGREMRGDVGGYIRGCQRRASGNLGGYQTKLRAEMGLVCRVRRAGTEF
jgi:hypothetical protein